MAVTDPPTTPPEGEPPPDPNSITVPVQEPPAQPPRQQRSGGEPPQAFTAEDVERIRQHPLVPANIAIYGYIYDVKSGKLLEVPEATTVGRAA